MTNINANLSKTLPPLVEKVVSMIVAFSGESPNNLVDKPIDELFQILATMLQCEKEFVQSLFLEHDQNVELDEVSSQVMWNLVSKGVLKPKTGGLGALTKDNFEHLKFLMAALVRSAILRAQRGQAAPTSFAATVSGISEAPIVVNSKNIFETYSNKAMLNEMIASNNNHVRNIKN